MRTNSHTWVATYYVSTRWGQTQEKTLSYPGRLPRDIVERNITNKLDRYRSTGQAILPVFDLQLEKAA